MAAGLFSSLGWLLGTGIPRTNWLASVFASLQPRSDADETQRCLRVVNAVTESIRDVRRSGATKQSDGQVAQGSHGLGSGSFTNLRAIFVEGHIPYPVQAVLDSPVASVESEKPVGRPRRRTQARYAEDHLVAMGVPSSFVVIRSIRKTCWEHGKFRYPVSSLLAHSRRTSTRPWPLLTVVS